MKLSYFSFQEPVPKSYIPDAVYGMCGEFTQNCNVCSNEVYSPQLGGYVHDTLSGKVFCPFGKNGTMNQPIYGDQWKLNSLIKNKPDYTSTTWGRAPQLDPRPLSKIGFSWRTS